MKPVKTKTVKGWRVTSFAKPGSAQFSKFDEPGARATRPSAIYESLPEASDTALGIMLAGGSAAIDWGTWEVPA